MNATALLREFTRVQSAPFVPEVRLHLASELVPLWQATEWQAAAPQPPPFWAFAWPGSMALARYLLDNRPVARDKHVLDFGSGGGLAAIAAALAGAAHVLACDVDPLATFAQQCNASLNGVTVTSRTEDATRSDSNVDLVLAGDVCYERDASEAVTTWLRRQTSTGSIVLLADPGRHYVPTDGLELLADYDVPVLKELESVETKRTRLWRMRSA